MQFWFSMFAFTSASLRAHVTSCSSTAVIFDKFCVAKPPLCAGHGNRTKLSLHVGGAPSRMSEKENGQIND